MQCLALHLGVNKVGGSVFRCLDFLTELPATCSTIRCCCQAHLPARAIAPFLYNHHLPSMPRTDSGEAKHFPGVLHGDSTRGGKWSRESHSGPGWIRWIQPCGICLWLAVPPRLPKVTSTSSLVHRNSLPVIRHGAASVWFHTLQAPPANSFKGMGRARCSLKSKHGRDRRESHLSPHSASVTLMDLKSQPMHG